MDYHGNPYLTAVNISDFATGRSDISYIIELSHVLYKKIAISGKQCTDFSFQRKWVGYFDPSL